MKNPATPAFGFMLPFAATTGVREHEDGHMNLHQLEYFIASINRGSFVEAAKALYITPQAIAKAISELEKELHLELFTRSGRSITPTLSGTLLATRVLEILQDCEDLKIYAALLPLEHESEITLSGSISLAIASSPYEGGIVSNSFFEDFRKHYPSIDLSLSYGSSGSCLSALQEGVVDSAIILGKYKNPDYICTKIFDSILCVATGNSHPLSQYRLVSLSDLKGYPIAKPHDLRYSFSVIEHRLRETNCAAQFIELIPTIESYNRFLHERQGIVFVSPSSALEELYSDTRFLPLRQEERIKIPVCFVYTEHRNNQIASFLRQRLIREAKADVLKNYPIEMF